jgi:hypothetical protein
MNTDTRLTPKHAPTLNEVSWRFACILRRPAQRLKIAAGQAGAAGVVCYARGHCSIFWFRASLREPGTVFPGKHACHLNSVLSGSLHLQKTPCFPDPFCSKTPLDPKKQKAL